MTSATLPPRSSVIALASLASLAAALAGCSAPPERPPSSPDSLGAEPETLSQAAPPEATAEPAAEPAAKPGPAYFGFKTRGLVRLDVDGRFTAYQGALEWVRDIAVCGDSLWVADARMGELYRGEGTKLEMVPFAHFSHKPQQIVCAGGATWGNAAFGVIERRDGDWAFTAREAIHPDANLFERIALDASGDVWLFDRGDKLYRRHGGSWNIVASPLRDGKPLKLRTVATGPGGAVFVAGDQGIFRRDGEGWADLYSEPVGYEPSVAVGTDDTLYVAVSHQVLVFPKGRAPAKTEEMGGHVGAIAIDGANRLWAAAEGNIYIVGADGTRTRWQPGAFPALAGEIERIGVVGAGPPLPAAPKPRTATVTGKVLVAGAARAGVMVAVCANPLLFDYAEHPCEKADPHFDTKTAADGTFSLRGVPSGSFYVAAGQGQQWSMRQVQILVEKDGATISVGTTELK